MLVPNKETDYITHNGSFNVNLGKFHQLLKEVAYLDKLNTNGESKSWANSQYENTNGKRRSNLIIGRLTPRNMQNLKIVDGTLPGIDSGKSLNTFESCRI